MFGSIKASVTSLCSDSPLARSTTWTGSSSNAKPNSSISKSGDATYLLAPDVFISTLLKVSRSIDRIVITHHLTKRLTLALDSASDSGSPWDG